MERNAYMKKYRSAYQGGEGEIVEKKSRFIATVQPVESEEEALAFVASMKKKYWNATHNCSAFVVGEHMELQRCSDDGEPQGTAGRPMLDVLLGEEIHNVAVVVTRYFGGTLLGTGGLVRAYSKAVQEGLKTASLLKNRRVSGCGCRPIIQILERSSTSLDRKDFSSQILPIQTWCRLKHWCPPMRRKAC